MDKRQSSRDFPLRDRLSDKWTTLKRLSRPGWTGVALLHLRFSPRRNTLSDPPVPSLTLESIRGAKTVRGRGNRQAVNQTGLRTLYFRGVRTSPLRAHFHDNLI